MFELFANPANMMIGGALISSPIIIHLINRMRYKRVRWAAMEFLLKSQKRNRRRLIIEQLILLLLRILLVLLAGLLLARFLGASLADFTPQNALHLVILDDRLSMTDQWKTEDGVKKNSYEIGKQIVEKEIAKEAMMNRSAQRLVLRRSSDPTRDLFDKRLNDDSMRELATTLGQLEECSKLHTDLYKSVEVANELLGKHPTDLRTLYIVSDFRQRHWFEPEATGLIKSLASLAQTNVKIRMVDVADPRRSETQEYPLYHDNLAIAELQPETRVAAQNSLVQFKVAVANNGASERKNVRVTIKVNGSERSEASLTMMSVPPGKPTESTFLVSFDQLGFNQITANLENEDFGIPADNLRFAVVEVRKQVPILVIDGDPANSDKRDGDTLPLRTLFNAAKGFNVVRGVVADLERSNLDQYASIYLLNVRELGTDKQLSNLENYVREGGGVAFFLGDRVTNINYYNKRLYNDGKGIFPAPIADQPSRALNEEEQKTKILQNLLDPQYQVFVRNTQHPIFKNIEVDKFREAFKYLTIERYFPVPRQRWKSEPDRVEELMTLPNDRPVSDYESSVMDILKDLPSEDAKYAKYRPGLARYRGFIRDKLGGKSLPALAAALTGLLQDKGVPNDPEQPNLVEFWQQTDPAIAKLRTRIDKLRETVQLGDPLMIASTFGKGRCVAIMTTAGQKWNGWSAGGPASFTFPMIMLETQTYLSSLGEEANLTVGTPQQFEVEGSRYEPVMRCYYQGEATGADAVKPAGEQAGPIAGKANLEVQSVQSGAEANGRLKFDFERNLKPGVYYFELTQRPTERDGPARTETRAFAFNVDTANESDLRRASRSELERIAKGAIKVRAAGGPAGSEASDRKNDLSESAWIYLVFLLILVAEQALAVHLSFHLKGGEAAPTGVRPQPSPA